MSTPPHLSFFSFFLFHCVQFALLVKQIIIVKRRRTEEKPKKHTVILVSSGNLTNKEGFYDWTCRMFK